MKRALVERLEALASELRERLQALPGEVKGLEDGGRRASAELARIAPEALGQIKSANRYLYAVAKRKGEEEALARVDRQLGDLVDTLSGLSDPPDVAEATILEAQEEERHGTAIRIHDGPAQILANTIMRLEFCQRLATRDGARAGAELEEVRRDLEGVLAEIRRLIFDLRPMTLDDLGLVPTLQRFAENERGAAAYDLQITVRGGVRRLGRDAETHLYRLVQQAVAEAVGLRGAKAVTVKLAFEPDALALAVEDDGAPEPESGSGQPQSRERREIQRRARAVGGVALWSPRPDKGIRLEVRFLTLARAP